MLAAIVGVRDGIELTNPSQTAELLLQESTARVVPCNTHHPKPGQNVLPVVEPNVCDQFGNQFGVGRWNCDRLLPFGRKVGRPKRAKGVIVTAGAGP